MRNPTDMHTAAVKFAEVSEAYDVLSNCKSAMQVISLVSTKAIYDHYG